jgi:hypothetical protein
MPAPPELIDRIVAAVLAQLRDERPAHPPRTASATLIDEAVITADLLADRAISAEVHIGPKSILTPAARDYIREQGIRWKRANGAPKSTTPGCTWNAVVVNPSDAVSQAVAELSPGKRELVGTCTDAAEKAVSIVCRAEAEGAVVFAESADQIACLANRNQHIRALVAHDPAGLERAAAEISPNVIIIRPAGRTAYELRNLLRVLKRTGPPKPPSNWPEQ